MLALGEERTGARMTAGARRLEGRPRRLAIAAAVAAGAVLVGAVLGLVLAGGSPPSRPVVAPRLAPLAAGVVVRAPDAAPKKLDEPHGMGSLHAGVAVLALGEVDQVPTADGLRRAPVGGRLVAFRLGDWTCETPPCADWRSLDPAVVVDGDSLPLPGSGDTFVVVAPPGSSEIDLVVDADNYQQSVSLTGGEDGKGNIVVLSGKDRERPVTIGRTFRLVEQTSIALDDGAGGRTDQFQRDVRVDDAQLRFFLDGEVPSRPDRAFLVVHASYSYAGRAEQFALGPGEVAFVAADGTRFEPRDLDPAPDKGLLGFEVPAGVRAGTLVIGGTRDQVSTTGVPYTSTLQEQPVPIALG
jgi:hypothetical protein